MKFTVQLPGGRKLVELTDLQLLQLVAYRVGAPGLRPGVELIVTAEHTRTRGAMVICEPLTVPELDPEGTQP